MPNSMLGVVGEHGGCPVEQIRQSADDSLIASCAHDQKIKFWNIESVKSKTVDTSRKATKERRSKNFQASAGSSDFFSGLAEADAK